MISSATNGSNAAQKSSLVDMFHRPIAYARIAVTSQCNLRCSYCMREEHDHHTTVPPLLTGQEISTIIAVLAGLGITKVRFTGGEPLLRRDILELVRDAKKTPGIKTVSLTTNGLLLDRFLPGLIEAGLDAVNFSIDTLQGGRYSAITRRNEFARVRANLDRLLNTTAIAVKINVVMMRDVNSDELQLFTALTREHAVTVRFMELQPFDDNQIWRTGRFLGAERIRELLQSHYPDLQTAEGHSTEYFSYTLPSHKGSIAIIPAYTRNFCSRCDRIRITSDGRIISCLYKKEGLELMPLLRANAGKEALGDLFRLAAAGKPEDGKHAARDSVRTSMSEIGG